MNKRAVVLALATALAVPAEGVRQWAYRDPPGILSVCYGHTGDVVKGKKYSMDECRSLLDKDMNHAVDLVEACHPALPENVLAAFADAVYNMGPAVACNSTASKYLAAHDYKAACQQLSRWDKAKVAGVYVSLPGLTKRREAERRLCES